MLNKVQVNQNYTGTWVNVPSYFPPLLGIRGCVCRRQISSTQGSSSWAVTATDDLLTGDVMRWDSAATLLITPHPK